jgi:SAM-dependent methyltransferase
MYRIWRKKLKMEYYFRENCRLCGCLDLEVVLKLKDSPICDAYITQKKKQNFYPLILNKCSRCDFVQLNTVISEDIIYEGNVFISHGSPPSLQAHSSVYCDDVCEFLKHEKGKLIVDVGSNNGSLLKHFQRKNYNVIGIGPSCMSANNENDKSFPTYSEYFDKKIVAQIVSDHGYADIITINNLFANIDDLDVFMLAVESLLDPEGVLIIESSYLFDMIQNMVFDFIYHEHLSYFSIKPLILFFYKYGMNLIHIQEITTKGGSLRYYIAREESKWKVDASVNIISKKEEEGDNLKNLFLVFADKIEKQKLNLLDFIDKLRGQTIVGFGASATSTTIISHFDLSDKLSYLVDDNPGKLDTYSPGYHLPVLSTETLKQNQHDVVIILAWRFKDEILKLLDMTTCKVIIPLPQLEILG